MYSLDLFLFIGIFLSLVLCFVIKKRIVYMVPIILVCIHFALSRFNVFVGLVYLAAFFIFLLFFTRDRKGLSIVLIVASSTCLAIPVGIKTQYDMQIYASMKSYAEAFKWLNDTLREEYVLAAYKEIDFDEKYQTYINQFEAADKEKSKAVYYKALSAYLTSFNDAHVSSLKLNELLGGQDEERSKAREAYIGGNYGFSVGKLDGGEAMVIAVDEESKAYEDGIRVGLSLTKWNGVPIEEAISKVPLEMAPITIGNGEGQERLRYMLLAQDVIGNKVKISFIDEKGKEQEIELTAEDDDYKAIKANMNTFYQMREEEEITIKELKEGCGYIKISIMNPGDEEKAVQQIQEAIEDFKAKQIQELIIDLRNNNGGSDEFGAKVMGLFTKEEHFYLAENTYSQVSDTYTEHHVIICEPSDEVYEGQIAILVNGKTVSAAEGFAYRMQELENVLVAGFEGSNGSFGTITNGEVVMPDGYIVTYPRIACLDEKGKVMLDTNAENEGGVRPDIKVPFDKENALALYEGRKDVELEVAMKYLKESNT